MESNKNTENLNNQVQSSPITLNNVDIDLQTSTPKSENSKILYTLPVKTYATFFIVSMYSAFAYCIISTHLHENYFEDLESKSTDAECPNRKFLKILSITQCITSYTPGKWIWRTILILNLGFNVFVTPKILFYSLKNKGTDYLAATSAVCIAITSAMMVPTTVFYDLNPPVSQNKTPIEHSHLHFGCFLIMTTSALVWITSYLMLILRAQRHTKESQSEKPIKNSKRIIIMIILTMFSAVVAVTFLILFHKSCLDYADGYFALSEYAYFFVGMAVQLDVMLLKREFMIEIRMSEQKKSIN